MPGTGATVGSIGGAAAGTAILPGVGTAIGGALGGVIGGLFDSNGNPTAPQGQYMPIDPNVGIGQGSFGLTPEEQARYAQVDQQRGALNGQLSDYDQRMAAFQAKWAADHPPAGSPGSDADPGEPPEGGAKTGGINRSPQAQARVAMQSDPEYQKLFEEGTGLRGQLSGLPTPDMSDPGRFAAMSDTAQGRAPVKLDQFGYNNVAGADIYNMQRQNAPQQYDPGQVQRADTFNAQQTRIDPTGANADYSNYQADRAKSLEVMGSVQDRAMGRGGPSPAELQMKQGQDRAVAQQSALAASGGQMDAAQSRRQAMLGAASIGQKTASDSSLLRANEQIAAQNTFSGMANSQQTADLGARNASFGQSQAIAQNDWQQSLANSQNNAQQSQFNAGQANQFNLGRAQTMAQQSQFGAQFGLSQEQAIAQSQAQQRQFNTTNATQQSQFGANFGAQQALNQANLTQAQRAQNDAYQNMMLNQYMASRGMQQANAFQNQNSYNQMAGINAGVGISNANLGFQQSQANRQQMNNVIGGVATIGAGYMASQGGASPAVGNSGFNQSDPSKIDFGY
jgi:hypothetical protein